MVFVIFCSVLVKSWLFVSVSARSENGVASMFNFVWFLFCRCRLVWLVLFYSKVSPYSIMNYFIELVTFGFRSVFVCHFYVYWIILWQSIDLVMVKYLHHIYVFLLVSLHRSHARSKLGLTDPFLVIISVACIRWIKLKSKKKNNRWCLCLCICSIERYGNVLHYTNSFLIWETSKMCVSGFE